MNIVELHDRAGQEIAELRKRLGIAVAQYQDKVDMELLCQVMEDLTNGKFSAGDLAAVYVYRLHEIIKAKQHG